MVRWLWGPEVEVVRPDGHERYRSLEEEDLEECKQMESTSRCRWETLDSGFSVEPQVATSI